MQELQGGTNLLSKQQAETLRMLGRSQVDDYSVARASAPDYLPFGITSNGSDYEGLTG